MSKDSQDHFEVKVVPATAERWKDLEALFGPNGAYSGCWCMYWRLKRGDFNKMKGEGRKTLLKNFTSNNQVPGLLAYIDDQSIGWCSIGPREDFTSLEKSRTLRRIDATPVWSIVCFFVAKPYRNKGILSKLLDGAVEYAEQQGAQVIEGYPIDLQTHKLAGHTLKGCSGYMGVASIFRAAGFVKVAEANETQLIMRYTVKNKEQPVLNRA